MGYLCLGAECSLCHPSQQGGHHLALTKSCLYNKHSMSTYVLKLATYIRDLLIYLLNNVLLQPSQLIFREGSNVTI